MRACGEFTLKQRARYAYRTLFIFIIIKPYYINREKKRERRDKTVKGRQRKSPMRCETKAKGEGDGRTDGRVVYFFISIELLDSFVVN